MQNVEEIMRDHPNHGRGWRRWSDRVFYQCDDGAVRSMTELSSPRALGAAQWIIRGMGLLRSRPVRRTVRSAFPRRQEFAF